MELDNIKSQTTWNDAAQGINQNFAKVGIELEKLKSTPAPTFELTPSNFGILIKGADGKFTIGAGVDGESIDIGDNGLKTVWASWNI